jgi:hypothetical protein
MARVEARVDPTSISLGTEPSQRLDMQHLWCVLCKKPIHFRPGGEPFYIRLHDGKAGGQIEAVHVECRDREINPPERNVT